MPAACFTTSQAGRYPSGLCPDKWQKSDEESDIRQKAH